jgi:predicted 3-demethylubiquinone-9 3-methyltransferase (glyoxalase superfamily)
MSEATAPARPCHDSSNARAMRAIATEEVMSKIAPCLWFANEAEEAANFYISLVPNSRIGHVQRNVIDSPGGKAGTVLVVEFTLAGQRFMALNGGTRIEHSWAISLHIECEDQAEVDRIWTAFLENGGKEQACGWVTDRYGVNWQIIPKILPQLLADPDPAKAARTMQAMLEMVKIDIEGLRKAYDGA